MKIKKLGIGEWEVQGIDPKIPTDTISEIIRQAYLIGYEEGAADMFQVTNKVDAGVDADTACDQVVYQENKK